MLSLKIKFIRCFFFMPSHLGYSDLWIVVNNPHPLLNSHVELRQTLTSVIENCQFIERLFFESSKTGLTSISLDILILFFLAIRLFIAILQMTGRDDSLKSPTCVDLVQKCPRLVSLALRGFKLHDYKVRILLKVMSAFTRNLVMHTYKIISLSDFRFLYCNNI